MLSVWRFLVCKQVCQRGGHCDLDNDLFFSVYCLLSDIPIVVCSPAIKKTIFQLLNGIRTEGYILLL